MSAKRERVFRYVPHYRVKAYEALGWRDDGVEWNAHHAAYSKLMEWTGEGEPLEPNDEEKLEAVRDGH